MRHPWITRNNTDPIPVTCAEELNEFEHAEKLRASFHTMAFLSEIRAKTSHESKRDMRKYKKLLNKVVTKIEKWRQVQEERRKGRFERDEDY